MARIVDSLSDVPAMVWTNLGEVLVQTPPAVALLGDYTRFTGLSRYLVYRYFTDPAPRELYPARGPRQARPGVHRGSAGGVPEGPGRRAR